MTTLGVRATVLLSAVGLMAGLVAPAAVAAGGPDELAQRLFREGVEAARQERWLDARLAFEKAYALSRRPVVLVNLAGAEVRTGRLVAAARDYHRILDGDAAVETAPFRKAAADVLPSLEARIPRIRFRPSDLSVADVVELDGQEIPPARLAEPQPLDPGAHTVVVKRSGTERARIAFSIAERESHEISLPVTIPPLSPPLAPAPVSLEARASQAGVSLLASGPTPEQAPPRAWWRSTPLWLATAGVAVAAAVVTIFAVERHDDLYTGNVPPGLVSVK